MEVNIIIDITFYYFVISTLLPPHISEMYKVQGVSLPNNRIMIICNVNLYAAMCVCSSFIYFSMLDLYVLY